jgi:hypothetical protein
LNKHQPVTIDMKFLAGLTKIRYVFFYPDTRDIVIAGPAEGFAPDPSGRMIGVFSKRPVLELQDLIVALRAFPPAGTKTGLISVSIDPTMEGLERLRRQVANIGHFVRPGDARAIATTLRRSLGKQIVSIKGVSPNANFAQVLVEADYRMKLIGIGLERPPVRIESYIDKANPATAAQNALKRWYFVPEYECVRVSEDGLAMELVGEVVKLVGEDQLVTPGGRRVVSRQVGRASRGFTLSFTRHYPSLAKQVPVYGQLKNLIDIAIAAAYVQHQDYYEQAEWNLGTFADEKRYSVEVFVPPQQVESAINVVWKGNTLMTPIGGGVNIQPSSALTDDRLIPDEENEVKSAHGKNRLEGLPKHVWWWD